MANAVVYVDSTAGGANNGTSWVNAYTTLLAAITASGTTGTDFYCYNGHTESGASLAILFKGVAATPDRFFSTGRTNSPPTTADLTAGAAFTTTAGSLSINGYVYFYGATLTAGNNGGNNIGIGSSSSQNGEVTLDTCTLVLSYTGGTATAIQVCSAGASINSRTTWINTTVQFGNAVQGIQNLGGFFRWYNTPTAVQGATLPTTLFPATSSQRGGMVQLDGVDLSAISAKTVIGAISQFQPVQLINCKLPASITLAVTPTFPAETWTDFICCDSTAVNGSSFQQARYGYQGTLTGDNTVYNGATDGVNPISWKVVTTANANPQSPFECFEIVQWAAAGTYAASTIVATSATAGLKTNDIWVDVNYLGTSGNPLAKRATTFGAGSGTVTLPQIPQGTSPGSVATGATWATGGAGTNYTLAVPSFTTTLAGYVRFTVRIAKATLTIYIDPKATIA